MNALREEVKTLELLEVGCRVHCTLYGGKDGTIYAIHGEQRPETVRTIGGIMTTGGNANFDIVWDNGSYSNGLSESLIRSSVQWSVYPDEKRSLIEIDMAKKNADNTNKREEEKREEAAAQRVINCDIMRLSKPHLKESEKYAGGKQCAKNIRIELKKAFKGVKFSVTSSYDTVNINWEDGPTYEQVEKLTSKYQEGSFNGMEDIYEYSSSPFNDVFGGCKYVFWNRHDSDKATERAIEEVFNKYDLGDTKKPTAEEVTKGECWRIEFPNLGRSLTQLIREACSGFYFCA